MFVNACRRSFLSLSAGHGARLQKAEPCLHSDKGTEGRSVQCTRAPRRVFTVHLKLCFLAVLAVHSLEYVVCVCVCGCMGRTHSIHSMPEFAPCMIQFGLITCANWLCWHLDLIEIITASNVCLPLQICFVNGKRKQI
jgi:hypothetical protein